MKPLDSRGVPVLFNAVMITLPFTKMHGLGNDFVVLDARRVKLDLAPSQAKIIADRRLGVGCDQILVIEPPQNEDADIFLRILNADGSEAQACGNGTRCIAALVMAETGSSSIKIETVAGVLAAEEAEDGNIAVDMGLASFEWQDIPLAREMDTLSLEISQGPLADPVAVNVGNPHAVFFVEDAAAIPLEELGPKIETDPLFPEHVNVEAAQVLADGNIRMRVWERGVGITRACGSGACATLAAAAQRGLTERSATVILDGGALVIDWREDNHVVMTGPVATSFSGVIDPAMVS